VRRNALTWIALIAATLSVVRAGVELVLQDGRVLVGADVRREGEAYLLEQDEGGVTVIPAPLVREVRLSGSAPDEERRAPSGFRDSAPETVAGPPVAPPRTSDQLRALGPPATFASGVVDPYWQPESDWEMDPHKNNNFAPAKWADGVIDPEWRAESAFDADKDVLAGNRSSFRGDIVDSSWQPVDGFAK
jgi:hypothetical protein